ncbi:MAG TPA: hypothetical protein CFH83_08920 [Sulfuricurvum kujiense]|uniref:Uncharacterized protein n=1 Tax=Sulfuricurvum kujiense TaxID=148813 RepID=A0A2D3W971_9BACT|nr:MAG TPA: hypothetical protein CFH83_08920 [Sulfuricurvum kujiense]
MLKEGTLALYAAVPSGVFSGSDLMEAARIAESQNGAIRLTIEQNLILTEISNEEEALSSSLFSKYPNRPSPYMANLIACAGSEHCPFGVIPGKSDAIAMSEFLSSAVPIENAKVRLYWSACIKGCGIHGAGDLGFVGCKVPRDGKTTLGVDIFLGGSLSHNDEEAKLFLKGITLEEAPHYVAELIKLYRDTRFDGESLEQFIKRLRSHYEISEIADIVRHNYAILHEGGADFHSFDRIVL